ncbi:DUF2799 domain-containing protein [Hyphococcus lacteus]|uniref:DUF2799 domain-containing protein n=1 Tax=Hyphococcus lacteus TaxID=3143536 RepID=A0ABV3Z2N4_9PROT
MRHFLVVLVSALGLSGCATEIMSEKECLAGNWSAAGFEDGAKGLLERTFDERAVRCNEFGAAANRAAYNEGRESALYQLCTRDGGYGYGQSGAAYLGVCRPSREAEFLSGYISGRRIFTFEQERNGAQREYNNAINELERHREEIRRSRAVLRDDSLTDAEHEAARKKLNYHREQVRYAERRADNTLYELGRADEAMSSAIRNSEAWERSDEFLDARDTLMEAHDFARAEPAIDFCTDQLPYHQPTCTLNFGAGLVDSQTNAVCAQGPGEARFVRRGVLRGNGSVGNQVTGFTQFFDFYRHDDRGRASRRPTGAFQVFFDERGTYSGVACSFLR